MAGATLAEVVDWKQFLWDTFSPCYPEEIEREWIGVYWHPDLHNVLEVHDPALIYSLGMSEFGYPGCWCDTAPEISRLKQVLKERVNGDQS